MMRFTIALALVVTTPMSVLAQTPSAPIREATDRAATTLAREARVTPPEPTGGQPRRWTARHPALTGALIGLGVGVPIGIATCRYPTAEGSSCSDYTFPGHARMLGGVTVGAIGAGVGAAAGALIGAVGR